MGKVFKKFLHHLFHLLLNSVLIRILIAQGEQEQAKELLKDIKKKIGQSENNDFFEYKISKARILLAITRLRDEMQAEQILRDLHMEKEKFHHTAKYAILLHLSEILLDELKLYGEQEVFEEVKSLINEIYDLGKKIPPQFSVD